jgi:hypothetical protein
MDSQNYFYKKWDIILPRVNKNWFEEAQKQFLMNPCWQGEVSIQNKTLQVFIQPIKNLENEIVKYTVIAYQK